MQQRREQLDLPLAAAAPGDGIEDPDLASLARALSEDLARRLSAPVRLVVTDNRSSVLRIRESEGVYHIRVHHIFLDAGDSVRRALAAWASGKGTRRAGRVLDEYIEARRDRIRSGGETSPQAPADPRGLVHDLKEIFDELNRSYFEDRVVARIGWGRWGGRRGRRRRSIKMGTYLHDARLIRIHPALDHPKVPRFYVAWVVFHEMLHQIVPPERRGGRTYYHPPAFRRLEASFREVEAARAWEARHFDLLLRPAPRVGITERR